MKGGGFLKDEDGSAVQRVVELSRSGGVCRYGDYIFGFIVAKAILLFIGDSNQTYHSMRIAFFH